MGALDRATTRITLQLGTERRSYEFSRAEFENLTYPLMDRTRRLTEEAARGEPSSVGSNLSGVLLVGGSTRMPMVRSYVTQMAGTPPRTGVNVDEVVAARGRDPGGHGGGCRHATRRPVSRSPGRGGFTT